MNGDQHDKGIFRGFIGLMVLIGGLGALAGLYVIDVPAGNKEPLLLAIGIVLGWGGSVVNSEYGATTTGRKVAEQAVRTMERQSIAAEQSPTGTPEDPLAVAGAQAGKPPVSTADAKP
jgi:hypothetical protein